jgi:hypothetical protein
MTVGVGRRLGLTGPIVVVVVALAACGGDDEPSVAEKRVAETKWIQRVDGACRKANEAIAERGWPTNLVDLDRLVVRGLADARAAVKEITALRIPEGAGPDPGRFVRELRTLEPALAHLSAASGDLEPEALVQVADELKARLATLDDRAKAAGLDDCVRHDERFLIPDAIRAPVFAERMAKIDRSLFRRLQRLQDRAPLGTVAGVARYFEDLGGLIEETVAAIDELEPPQWAAGQVARYQDVLRDLQTVVGSSQSLFAQGRAAVTLPKLRRLERQYGRVTVAERKARGAMLKAVGAVPTSRPEEQPEQPLPEDESEES